MVKGGVMSQGNEALVREAYEAYGRGDVDRNYLVLTLRDDRIIAMRACRDDREARQVAGLA
jgi:hypothetical protein